MAHNTVVGSFQGVISSSTIIYASTLGFYPGLSFDPVEIIKKNAHWKHKYFISDTKIVCHKKDFHNIVEPYGFYEVVKGNRKFFCGSHEVRTYQTRKEYDWEVILS